MNNISLSSACPPSAENSPSERSAAVENALGEFCTHLLAAGRSPLSIACFSREIRGLSAFLGGRQSAGGCHSTAFDCITPGMIDQYIVSGSLRADGGPKAINTVNRQKSALRSFFRWASVSGLIADDPTAHLKSQYVRPKPPVFLSTLEERTLLRTLRDNPNFAHRTRDLAIIRLLLDTGLRVSELAALDVKDLDLPGKRLSVRRQKGGDPLSKFIPSAARQVLADYIKGERQRCAERQGSGALFLNQRGGRLHSRGVQMLVAKWGARAGLAKKIRPHALRHTHGSRLYSRTKDILLVKRALGHRSIKNSLIYVHASDDQLQEALEERSQSAL